MQLLTLELQPPWPETFATLVTMAPDACSGYMAETLARIVERDFDVGDRVIAHHQKHAFFSAVSTSRTASIPGPPPSSDCAPGPPPTRPGSHHH